MEGLALDDVVMLAERESGAHGLADLGLKARLSAILDWMNATGPHSERRLRAMRQQVQRLLVARLRIALDRARIREQGSNIGMRMRVLRADQHVDFVRGEKVAQRAPAGILLDSHRLQ